MRPIHLAKRPVVSNAQPRQLVDVVGQALAAILNVVHQPDARVDALKEPYRGVIANANIPGAIDQHAGLGRELANTPL